MRVCGVVQGCTKGRQPGRKGVEWDGTSGARGREKARETEQRSADTSSQTELAGGLSQAT